MTLPTAAQFQDAIHPLQAARDAAFVVSILTTPEFTVDVMRTTCIARLKEAVEALGFEIVERLEGKGMREP